MKYLILIIFTLIVNFTYSQNWPKVKFSDFESIRTGSSLFTYRLINKNNIVESQLYKDNDIWKVGVQKTETDSSAYISYLNTRTQKGALVQVNDQGVIIRRSDNTLNNDITISEYLTMFRMGSSSWLIQEQSSLTRFKCITKFEKDLLLPYIKTITGKTFGIVLDGDTLKKQLLGSTIFASDTIIVDSRNDTIFDVYSNNNLRIGYLAGVNLLKPYNIAIGSEALSKTNIDASKNLALGNQALYNNTSGSYNCAIGYQSLKYNIEGNYNLAIGAYSLNSNTYGGGNIALGAQALEMNTEGSGNIALGSTLLNNTLGQNNIAVGGISLFKNTTGSDNISLLGLNENISGNDNLAIMTGALELNTEGSHNIAIGNSAGRSVIGSNNILIGYKAGYTEIGSNKLYISNSETTTPLIKGDFSTNKLELNADLYIPSAQAFYFGNEQTDGSWRIIRNGDNLLFQRLEVGTWVTKQTM
jgi:hypothetical protein